MNLISKITISISIALLLVMGPFAYINVTTLKRLMLEEAIHSADNLGETILRTTHYQMLENDRKRVYQMIREVGTQKGIKHIRIVNKDGQIIFSTEEAEIGTSLDKTAAACNMCHSSQTPLIQASTMNRSRIFVGDGGEQVLGMTRAIYNEPVCATASCHFHPPNQRILGVLDIILSMENVRSQTSSYRRSIVFLTILMLGITSVCLTLLMWRLVNKPLRQILGHTKRVAGGDLETRLDFTSRDELGELADAFNGMTQNLLRARGELEDWAHNLESKVEHRTKQLKQMQAQLVRSEKLASLGELVAGIAHELNNPLTGILVFASLLEKNPTMDSSTHSDVEVIVRETQRCATIVKGLLEFSRESIPDKKPTSLNAVMENTLSLIGNQSFFHDIVIRTDYSDQIPAVLVDPNQIEQVFINVLLNAAHAMAGSGTLTIRTSLSGEPGWALVEIEDTGCGIPDENLGRIFDPFFTTKASKGTGLGLSVSYGIIQNHGGQIEVQSTVGQGTTFTLKFPLGESQDADVSDAGEPKADPIYLPPLQLA